MNIEEAYVSLEVAKLLKEKGFDWKCFGYYVDDEPDDIKYSSLFETNSDWEERCCSAPTQQMAMKWLREVHNIKVNVFYSNFNCYAIEYFETNTQTGVDESVFIGDGYKSYEEAVETALKYCLENLI